MKRMSKGMTSAIKDYHSSVEGLKRSLKRVATEAIKDGGDDLETVKRLSMGGVDPEDVMFAGVLTQKAIRWIMNTEPDYLSWTKRMYFPVHTILEASGLNDLYHPIPEIRLEERREY